MARTFLLKQLFVLLCLVHGLAGVRNLRSYYNSPRLVERNGGNDYYKRYAPTWPSLDSRPLPDWYDKAKVGIFIHWGVFSVPSFGSEWFWQNWRGAKSQQIIEFMKANYKQGFTYQDFAKDFTAEFFDPNQWADLFRRSGARYVVLTSKHHEGYTLWPSEYSFSWNAKDVGPHRDLVGDLAQAVRSRGLIFGLYHSLYEWFNPMYLSDKASGFQNKEFVLKKILPEMRELIVKYKPWVLWSDGDAEAPDTYWNSTQFLAWLYNDSPVKDTVVANDRWGRDIPCKHGDFYTCDDRYNPGDLAQAVRSRGLIFGLYHSLYEWFNPMYLSDKASGFQNREFVLKKILPEMRELIVKYKPWVLWSDGDWEASDTYWNSTQFLAWLYNDSPVKDTVVANDRWGRDIPCKHGDFYTCEDRYNPGVLQKHKWENAMTIDKNSWGFRRNANLSDYLTTRELIKTLVETVSCGGNILINVGPTKEGIITPIFQERLLDLGRWLTINGEAIYESHPWQSQNDTRTQDVWYTTRNNNVYAITLRWPPQNILWLGSPLKLFTDQKPIVQLLGNNGTLQWGIRSGVVFIRFPDKASVINEWAYVLKFLVL